MFVTINKNFQFYMDDPTLSTIEQFLDQLIQKLDLRYDVYFKYQIGKVPNRSDWNKHYIRDYIRFVPISL